MLNLLIAVEQDVEVDVSGSLVNDLVALHVLFYGLKLIQKLQRTQVRFYLMQKSASPTVPEKKGVRTHLAGTVQEPILIRDIHGRRLVQAARPLDRDAPLVHEPAGLFDLCDAIPHVAAQGDVGSLGSTRRRRASASISPPTGGGDHILLGLWARVDRHAAVGEERG